MSDAFDLWTRIGIGVAYAVAAVLAARTATREHERRLSLRWIAPIALGWAIWYLSLAVFFTDANAGWWQVTSRMLHVPLVAFFLLAPYLMRRAERRLETVIEEIRDDEA